MPRVHEANSLGSSNLATLAAWVIGLGLLYTLTYSWPRRALLRIDLLRFEPIDQPHHYVTKSKDLVHRGYVRYNQNGESFRLKLPALDPYELVVLPGKYLEELKNAHESKLSFLKFSEKAMLLHHACGPQQSRNLAGVLRHNLKRCSSKYLLWC